VCKAVKNEVRSAGDSGGGGSGAIACKEAAEEVWTREKLCLSDEKPLEVEEEREF
jgi:hypothetical protein